MVNCQKLLVDHLGIERLLSVSGGDGRDAGALLLTPVPGPGAQCYTHLDGDQALASTDRLWRGRTEAIMSDIHWKSGNYYGGPLPARGLSVARMVGHITYMSDTSMHEKFGRQRKDCIRSGLSRIDCPRLLGVDLGCGGGELLYMLIMDETPNLHFLSICDFFVFCRDKGITIERCDTLEIRAAFPGSLIYLLKSAYS